MHKRTFCLALCLTFLSSCQAPTEAAPAEIRPYVSAVIPSAYCYIGGTQDTFVFLDADEQRVVAYGSDGRLKFQKPCTGDEFDIKLMDGVICYPNEYEMLFADCSGRDLPCEEYACPGAKEFSGEFNAAKGNNGLWGYVNRQGKWVVEPQFRFETDFLGALAYVETPGGEKCFLDREGNVSAACIDGRFDRQITSDECAPFLPSAPRFCENRLLVQKEVNEILISTFITDTNQLLPSEFLRGKSEYPYRDGKNFREGMAAVQVKELWGYIRLDGSTAIRPTFQQAFSFMDGRAIVQLDSGDWCYIDQNGQVIEPVKLPEGYVPTGLHGGGYVAARREDGATDIISGAGEVVFSFDKGWIKLSDEETGSPIWEITSGDLPFLTYDLFLPRCGRLLSGMVTQSCGDRIVTDGRNLYDLDTGALRFTSPQMMAFSDGLAVALGNHKWGYIDLDGNWAIPPIFDQAEAFVDGFAYVRSGDVCGLIPRNTDWSDLEAP